jgi:anti-sigma regulatory factor (Ser/Thr protein kinase)
MASTDSDRKVSLQVGNSIAEMTKVVDLVDRFGVDHNLPQNVTNELNLCLDEILNNTISYGYDDESPRCILVSLWISGGFVIAEVQDDGKPFDPWSVAFATPKGDLRSRKVGGLGIHFVKTLMDGVDYARLGNYNVVKIKKKLDRGVDNGHC